MTYQFPANHFARPSRANNLSSALMISIALLVIMTGLGFMITGAPWANYFLLRQDIPVVLAIVTMCILLRDMKVQPPAPLAWSGASVLTSRKITVISILLFLIGWAGHYLILNGYAFSRDEQMVWFDSQIFASGALIAPVPDLWNGYKGALNDMFMQPSAGQDAWLSVYRPVNAMLHTIGFWAGDVAMTAPVLTAITFVVSWRIAKQLFPGDAETQIVMLVLLAVNAQLLLTSMTLYAMAGHLAFNTIWLWLFLRDGKFDQLGAMLIGFLAIGMHQVTFHSAFALPFILLLFYQRRINLGMSYLLSYAVFGIFWLLYFWLPLSQLEAAPAVQGDGNGLSIAFAFGLIGQVLGNFGPDYIFDMAANLVRFAVWQHILWLPLFVVGVRGIVKSRNPVLITIFLAIAATICMKLLLRPDQGHGWGYRYLHGIIGLAAIIAAAGWQKLRQEQLVSPRLMAVTTAITAFAVIPWLFFQANRTSETYAQISRDIDDMPADIVIIDDQAALMARDLVINAPDVSNRPVRMMASRITADQVKEICAKGSMDFIYGERMRPIADLFNRQVTPSTEHMHQLRKARPGNCAAD